MSGRQVVHVLSDDPDWPGEHGFITREIIEKYAAPNSTFLFCGPLAMCRFVRKALEDMGVPQRRFRHDVVNNPADISTCRATEGYGGKDVSHHRRARHSRRCDRCQGKRIRRRRARAQRYPGRYPLPQRRVRFLPQPAARRRHLRIPHQRRRRAMDKELSWFHACSAYPLSI